MRTSFLSGTGIAVVGALALWGCGSSSSGPTGGGSPTGPSSGQTVTVSIVSSIGNGAYKPNPVSANAGDTVNFRNNDSATHHIVLDDGSADLGTIAPGATSAAVSVRSKDATKFHCTIHPSMVGSINGDQAPVPPPCNDPYGYGC